MVVKKLLILIVLLVGLILLLSNYKKANISKSLVTPVVAPKPISQTSEVRSIEGDKKLIMTTKSATSGAVSFFFSTTDESGKKSFIFSKTVTSGESMALPLNSWSPNNKYIFIEDKNGYLTDYLVFKANGENFSDGQKFLNATALFNTKVKNYNLKSITGWDDPVLMSVYTTNGPRYWFDITTQSFIQLVR